MGYIVIENNTHLSDLKIIELEQGNVMHALKRSSRDFCGFGEAYFSKVKFQSVKAWKRHTRMTLNIIVPVGEIRFIVCNSGPNSKDSFGEFILSNKNYKRLTIPPGLWFGFQGLAKRESMLLNIANIEHHPDESEKCSVDKFDFDWKI